MDRQTQPVSAPNSVTRKYCYPFFGHNPMNPPQENLSSGASVGSKIHHLVKMAT